MIFLTAYLAKNTNWSEKYILNMPFFKVLQMVHAFTVIDGLNTRWKSTDASVDKLGEKELGELLDMI